MCEFSQNKYYWYYYSQQRKRIFLAEFRWESAKKDVKIDPFALAFGLVHPSDINLFKAESALISNISPLYVKWDMNYLPVFQISAQVFRHLWWAFCSRKTAFSSTALFRPSLHKPVTRNMTIDEFPSTKLILFQAERYWKKVKSKYSRLPSFSVSAFLGKCNPKENIRFRRVDRIEDSSGL